MCLFVTYLILPSKVILRASVTSSHLHISDVLSFRKNWRRRPRDLALTRTSQLDVFETTGNDAIDTFKP